MKEFLNHNLYYYIDCLIWIGFSISLVQVHLIISIFAVCVATAFTLFKFYDYLLDRKKLKLNKKLKEDENI